MKEPPPPLLLSFLWRQKCIFLIAGRPIATGRSLHFPPSPWGNSIFLSSRASEPDPSQPPYPRSRSSSLFVAATDFQVQVCRRTGDRRAHIKPHPRGATGDGGRQPAGREGASAAAAMRNGGYEIRRPTDRIPYCCWLSLTKDPEHIPIF